MTAFRPWPAPPAQVRHSPSRMTVFLLQTRRQVKDIVPSFPARDATWHCPRRADILSALDAAQPLSGSYEHWTPKADRMSARRSFGRDGGGSARMPLRTGARTEGRGFRLGSGA